MKNYLDLLRQVAANEELRATRNGDVVGEFGGELVYDMQEGYPLPTTKFVPFESVMAELVGFIKGVTSAADFRQLGTNIWNKNANDPGTESRPNSWLSNPHRKGEDDLGPVYGAQWRRWESVKLVEVKHSSGGINSKDIEKLSAYLKDGYIEVGTYHAGGNTVTHVIRKEIDQLQDLIDRLQRDPNSRYHVVTAWNPGCIKEVALPACHAWFQCYVRGSYIDLKMYQRSADMFLGVPFNIASYAALLHLIAKLVGKLPGKLTLTFGDLHVYADHRDAVQEQLARTPSALPSLTLKPIDRLDDISVDHFVLNNYNPQPAIKAPMAV